MSGETHLSCHICTCLVFLVPSVMSDDMYSLCYTSNKLSTVSVFQHLTIFDPPPSGGGVTVNGLKKCVCVCVCDPAVPQELDTPII